MLGMTQGHITTHLYERLTIDMERKSVTLTYDEWYIVTGILPPGLLSPKMVAAIAVPPCTPGIHACGQVNQ
jgi:hypothetical protein